MEEARVLVETLKLPYACLRTLYAQGSEVRRYRNSLTGAEQVGKRIDTLGKEMAVAVREAKILQTITHENLVKIFDVAQVTSPELDPLLKVVEFIMPYFPRGSVCDALLRGERFSVSEAVLSIQAVLQGLGVLHETHRILHRDVKSGNVFLSDDGSRVKVGDLGLAVPLDEREGADAYPSTQLSTAPEAFPTKRLDRRSDLYGAGLILLEMLNGPFPYAEYSTSETHGRLVKGLPAVRRSHLKPGPQVPRGLRRVLRKSLSARPADRYPTASAMLAAVAKADFVDWLPVRDDGDRLTWTGLSARRTDREFQVTAEQRGSGAWRLTALQRVTRWQRFLDDVDVASLSDGAATAFFDQVVTVAAST